MEIKIILLHDMNEEEEEFLIANTVMKSSANRSHTTTYLISAFTYILRTYNYAVSR